MENADESFQWSWNFNSRTATTQFKAFLDEKFKMFCADFDGFLQDRFRLDEFYLTRIGVQSIEITTHIKSWSSSDRMGF